MDKRKQRLIDLAVILVITLLTLPILAFCLGGGGLGESWHVQPHINPDGEARTEYAVYKLEYGEKQSVNSIYLNVASYDNENSDKIEITFYFTRSLNNAKGTSVISSASKKASLDASGEDNYLFVKGVDNISETSTYVRVGVKNNLFINEIVFVDKENAVINASFVGARTWKDDKYDFFEKGELSDYGAKNAVDASDSLRIFEDGAVNFSKKQAELAAAANSFLRGDGYFVSKTHGALGVIFSSAGIALFKTGLFGLSFTSYLCLLCSLIIIYFACKKFFENWVYAACGVAVFVFCGLGISAAIGASASSLALPFAVGAFALALIYLKNPASNPRLIAASGVLFSFALAIDFNALVTFLPLASIAVFGAAREIKAFSDYNDYVGLEREYRREKYKKVAVSSVLRIIACFIVFPILVQIISYGAAIITYANYYSVDNIFSIIKINNHALFTASKAEDSLVFGWLIGLGSEASREYGSNFAEICANPFVICLGTASIILLTVFALIETRKNNNLKSKIFTLEGNSGKALTISFSFIACFLSLLVFGLFGAYQSYLYAQTLFCFSIMLAFKYIYEKNQKVARIIAIIACVVCVLFEVVYFTEILQLGFFPSIKDVISNGIKAIF